MLKQREIKFRLWDTQFNRMMFPYAIALVDYTENGTKQYHDVHYTNMNMCMDPEDGILMQYTGLKDKNGKEIYEGDIVLYCFRKTLFEAEVKFIEGRFSPVSGLHSDNYEVIGNIYENPELVEKL